MTKDYPQVCFYIAFEDYVFITLYFSGFIMRLTPLIRVYWNIPKGPKAPLYRQFKYFNLAEPEKYGYNGLKSGISKPVALAKNLLHDAPELFTCCLLAFIGNYKSFD